MDDGSTPPAPEPKRKPDDPQEVAARLRNILRDSVLTLYQRDAIADAAVLVQFVSDHRAEIEARVAALP